MQSTKENLSDTKVKLVMVGEPSKLQAIKDVVLTAMARDTRIPGFRSGKAPMHLVEKHVSTSALQTEFLDRAVNNLYVDALKQHNLRPVARPEVNIRKFVPFTTLEVEAIVEVVGAITLSDYTKLKLPKKPVTVTSKDIEEVIGQLRKREADKKDVARAAKDGDEVVLDFVGTDAKTKEPIEGTDAKNYPLTLGSNAFIPGFEANVTGLKAGDVKEFEIVFPKDYGLASLQNRKVVFAITVHAVRESIEPEVNDAFAAKAGPFKTVEELKADIKKQLTSEKQYRADREYTDELLTTITKASKVAVPEVLITEQLDRMLEEQKRNTVYRGASWQDFLKDQNTTEDDYREKLRPDAELRVKAGLVLGAIADKEHITVTPRELDARMSELKAQYTDAQMQAELAKLETRQDIASRMLSEKTADKLVAYATSA